VQQPPVSPTVHASDPSPSPSNLISLRLILVIGCDREMEARCRAIASRARVLLRFCSLPVLRSEIAAMRPLVIMLPANVYERAPWGFEVLAEKVVASLLMLDGHRMTSILLNHRAGISIAAEFLDGTRNFSME
jgi:hypothetical protein